MPMLLDGKNILCLGPRYELRLSLQLGGIKPWDWEAGLVA